MGMLVIRVYSFDCDTDGCGAVSDDFVPIGAELADAARHARLALRREGWTFGPGTLAGCPKHPIGAQESRA